MTAESENWVSYRVAKTSLVVFKLFVKAIVGKVGLALKIEHVAVLSVDEIGECFPFRSLGYFVEGSYFDQVFEIDCNSEFIAVPCTSSDLSF